MPLMIRPMHPQEARAIAAWRYAPPYDFYNTGAEQCLAEPRDSPDGPTGYFSVFDELGELIGFFCFGEDARVPGGDYRGDGTLDIGLGLRPDRTGQARGFAFVLAGLDFARQTFTPTRFRLSVATFNQRAIRVYERAGFAREQVFFRRTAGDEQEFVQMSRPA